MPDVQDPDAADASRASRPLLDAVRQERRRIAAAALGAVTHQTCEAFVPVVIGAAVGQAIAPGDTVALLSWLGLLALLFVALTLAYRLQLTAGERAVEHAQHRLRMGIARRALDPAGIDPARTPADVAGSAGALVSVASSDARTAALGIEAVVVAVGAVAAIGVSAIVLLAISLPLGLLVLLGAPPVVLILRRVAVPLEDRSEAQQARAADASAVATDLLRGIRVLKGLGAEAAAEQRYRRASQSARRASLAAAVPDNVLAGVNVVVSGLFLGVVAYVGGRLALDGRISVGDLIAAVGLTQFLLGPLQRIGWALGLLAQARGAARRVAVLLAAAPVVDGGGAALPDPPNGELMIGGLRTAATAGEALDLQAEPGEHLGIVVADASEAAELLDVLARRRALHGAEVRVAGVALEELPVAEAHRLLLVADHDADLFDGTVTENLARHGRSPSPQVLAASGVDDVLETLPAAGDAQVGERGSRLSGGQRQRVALARALGADAPVLVLHDPTTAVDAVTEQRIAAGIRTARQGRTTLLVTTSPTLLAACDRVVLVAGGRVVADGDHARLAAAHEAYREVVLR